MARIRLSRLIHSVNELVEHLFVIDIDLQLPRTAHVNPCFELQRWGGPQVDCPSQDCSAYFIPRIGCEYLTVQVGDTSDSRHTAPRTAKPGALQRPVPVPI